MKRDLPSLNALRAFEAAARNGGFVSAAVELGVTPAAVSHQIKNLEESLNIGLFVRHRRSVELTEVGRRLFLGLNEHFERLEHLIAALRQSDSAPVTVAAPSAFGAKWLAPRLEHFLAMHSGIAVRLQPQTLSTLGHSSDVDLVIRYESLETTKGIPLFEDWVFPVCAPVIKMALNAPTGLAMQTLLYDEAAEQGGFCATWADWKQEAGVLALQPANVRKFGNAAQTLEAALRAQGVALGRGSLVLHELRLTSLVRPFETAVPNGWPYVLVPASASAPRAAVVAFRDWLVSEAETFRRENPRLVR